MVRLFVRFTLVFVSSAVVLSSQVVHASKSCLMSSGPRCDSVLQSKRVTYRTYSNARYQYSIVYPVGLLEPQGEAENGDGQKFVSKSGNAELIVFGANNIDNETTKGAYAKAVRAMGAETGGVVTYKVIKGNWFVVSGRHDSAIFYSKTIHRGDTVITFIMKYPFAERATYDPITARIAKSFSG